MADALIVKSKVAELIRSQDMMMASDSYDALNTMVADAIKRAVKRCKDNGRKTVKPQDF